MNVTQLIAQTAVTFIAACGHTGPFQGKMNLKGEWQGTCVQCGGPVKIEMTVQPAPKIGFKKD